MGPRTETKARRGPNSGKDTRDEILEAAADLIVTEGYMACTMRSISERVKIKAGSLYHHFASKDEIVVEIMNRGTEMMFNQVTEALAVLPEGASFSIRLSTAIEAHVACKLATEAPYMRVYEHLTPVIKRQSRAMRRRYTELWLDLIESGKREGAVRMDLDAEKFVPFVLTGLNRLPEWFHSETMELSEITDMIHCVLTEGVERQTS